MYKYGKHVAQEKHDTVRNVIVPHVELRFSPVLFWEFRLIRELRLIFHGVGSSAVLASAAMSRQIRRTRHGTALLSSCRYRLAALGQRLERRSVTERYPWPKPKARATRVHCHLWYNTGSSATGHCRIRRLVRDLTVCSCHRDVPLYSDTFSTLWPRNSSENVFYYKTIVNSTNFNDVSNVLFPACLSDIKISSLRLGLQSRFPGSVIFLVSSFASAMILQRILTPSGFYKDAFDGMGVTCCAILTTWFQRRYKIRGLSHASQGSLEVA